LAVTRHGLGCGGALHGLYKVEAAFVIPSVATDSFEPESHLIVKPRIHGIEGFVGVVKAAVEVGNLGAVGELWYPTSGFDDFSVVLLKLADAAAEIIEAGRDGAVVGAAVLSGVLLKLVEAGSIALYFLDGPS
jgi:hypothetical protein